MTSSNQQITRCPKCGTAFRITRTQLQSANGAVRCGSCLNVFKALDYLVTPPAPKTGPTAPTRGNTATKPAAPKADLSKPITASKPATSSATPTSTIAAAPKITQEPLSPLAEKSAPVPQASASLKTSAATKIPEQPAILSTIKPLPINPAPVTTPAQAAKPTPQKPVVRVLDKSSLDQVDDILISDDMEDVKAETKSYDFDGFLDLDIKPKSDISLFDRKIKDEDEEKELPSADESWAEMLIEEEDDTPGYQTQRSPVITTEEEDFYATEEPVKPVIEPAPAPEKPAPAPAASSPSLVFSLIGEKEAPASTATPAPEPQTKPEDDLIISDELARIPDHSGFKPAQTQPADKLHLPDPDIFETPDSTAEESGKRQVKTQPKIRSYEGSRAALLMNIIPAPIEFTAKRMHRWYQRKLWPALSLLALVALVIQLAWFKFDYFSRVEPYRTAYTFLCPYLGCQVPTLVDARQINAFNLVVREHPEAPGALAVDVMIMNNAPFDQPYPDLVLMFTDLDEKEVASRRFSPKEYLGGEAAGSHLMPQKQPVHLTLDLVDPGESAVNYHIYIPQR